MQEQRLKVTLTFAEVEINGEKVTDFSLDPTELDEFNISELDSSSQINDRYMFITLKDGTTVKLPGTVFYNAKESAAIYLAQVASLFTKGGDLTDEQMETLKKVSKV